MYDHGYAIVSTKEFSYKSICFLCGSGPELGSQVSEFGDFVLECLMINFRFCLAHLL